MDTFQHRIATEPHADDAETTSSQPPFAPIIKRAEAPAEELVVRERTDVVVGYDGTVAADAALGWGSREADRRGVRLRVICANAFAGVEWESLSGHSVPPTSSAAYMERITSQGHDRARQVLAESRVTTTPVPAYPVQALVQESQTASLVVLGHPSRNRFGEIVAGSVVNAVTAHADCDVAVVPRGELVLPGPTRPVVVGVDGAPEGELAAQRAAEYAVRWGAALEVVQAWRSSSAVAWPEGLVKGSDGITDETEYFEKFAHQSVERAAAAARDAHPGLTVRTLVIEEHPATALTDIAATPGLLVVGTRGLGGFERLMLGSTSRAVLHRATVPVVVARG